MTKSMLLLSHPCSRAVYDVVRGAPAGGISTAEIKRILADEWPGSEVDRAVYRLRNNLIRSCGRKGNGAHLWRVKA